MKESAITYRYWVKGAPYLCSAESIEQAHTMLDNTPNWTAAEIRYNGKTISRRYR